MIQTHSMCDPMYFYPKRVAFKYQNIHLRNLLRSLSGPGNTHVRSKNQGWLTPAWNVNTGLEIRLEISEIRDQHFPCRAMAKLCSASKIWSLAHGGRLKEFSLATGSSCMIAISSSSLLSVLCSWWLSGSQPVNSHTGMLKPSSSNKAPTRMSCSRCSLIPNAGTRLPLCLTSVVWLW